MRHKPGTNPLLFLAGLLLSACSPHPGAGNWVAMEKNEQEVSGLTLSYDGRALFVSRKPAATWHCFWSGRDRDSVRLDCTPSTDKKREEHFIFSIEKDGSGILKSGNRVLGRFRRVDGRPDIS
ncbi:hypothetical protein [Thiolapillus sp.]